MNKKSDLVIGVVTFNNLDVVKRCFPSWRQIPNARLHVWDNGSDGEMREWLEHQQINELILQISNAGCCVARNRLIESARDRGAEYVLIVDSDVLIHEGAVEHMLSIMERHPDAGFVAFDQANKGFPVGPNGVVEEVANECVLSRVSMWREIGGYPECQTYYSGDSWKSTIANMHGWRTYLVPDHRGYDHFAHSSRVNRGMSEVLETDAARWRDKERKFYHYWRTRLRVGKGQQYAPRRCSQHEEDDIICEFFGGATGRVLDLGAGNGLKDSNSRRLLLSGWKGVLVEPSFRAFAGLFDLYADWPSVRLLNAAVAKSSGIVKFWDNPDGLATCHQGTLELANMKNLLTASYHIQAVCPDELAEKFGTEFDFVSIDCEGVDLEVFKCSARLLKHTKLVCFEHKMPGREMDDAYYAAWLDALEAQGFTKIVGVTQANTLVAR